MIRHFYWHGCAVIGCRRYSTPQMFLLRFLSPSTSGLRTTLEVTDSMDSNHRPVSIFQPSGIVSFLTGVWGNNPKIKRDGALENQHLHLSLSTCFSSLFESRDHGLVECHYRTAHSGTRGDRSDLWGVVGNISVMALTTRPFSRAKTGRSDNVV